MLGPWIEVKLDMVKQEMARMNISILGISELKWTRTDKFNSGGQYIYYCGQESLRRNGVVLIVIIKVWNAVTGCNLKNERMISVHFWSLIVHFQCKPFDITVIQVYALTSNAEEAEVEQFYEDLHDRLELTSKKDTLFIIGYWNTKVESHIKFGLGV